jgi:hypothetical protein
MKYLPVLRFLGVFVAGMFCCSQALVQAGPLPRIFGSPSVPEKHQAATQVPLEQLHPNVRSKVQQVLQNPTLYTHGPVETFQCQPAMYSWLLDNPDRTMQAWQQLGAKCIEITNRGNGVFGWSDDQGSDVWWQTIYPGRNMRIWYAEGQVKPGKLLPMVPVQCVVILHHDVVDKGDKQALMQHKADIFVRTSSRAAALITRMMGPSVPHLAEQAASQMQMFFAAMAWYCQKNPERATTLFQNPPPSTPALNSFNPLEGFVPKRNNPWSVVSSQ